MVLGIAGSRKRNTQKDYQLLKKRIIDLKPELIVTTGILHTGPDLFAKQIAEELGIPLKEYPCQAGYFPPGKERRIIRETEMHARDLRRALVGLHADYLLFMTHPDGKHGEIITAYWFMKFRVTHFERYKSLEMI